jgi:hypothetical protein
MASGRLAVQSSRSDNIKAGLAKWRDVPPGVIPFPIANEFMARLQAGSTVRKLTGGGQFGPPMVPGDRFKRHCASHPEWAEEAWKISKKNVLVLKGARNRNRTHCIHGHALSGDNLYVSPGRTERKCRICLKRRYSTPTPATQEQIQQAIAALNAGKSITEVCHGTVNGKKVCEPIFRFRKLKLLRTQNPAFHNLVLSVSVGSGSRAQMRRYHPQKARREKVRSETNDFYKIVGMVPRHLPPDAQDDIAQSIMIALLEGTLQRDQIAARIREFVQDRNRMFPPKFAKFGDARLVSLDEVMFEDGSATRGDTVSRGLWD